MVKKRYVYYSNFQASLFLQVFYELIAMTGYTLARLFNDGKGIFLAFCGDEKFRVRKLELNHILGDIDIRVV